MKPASINEIKQELIALPPKKITELCLRLARYKKENKELLTYLLFEAHNEQAFVETIRKEIDEQFSELPKATPYLTAKSLRKILRSITKYCRYIDSKESEIDIRIHFCSSLKNSGIRIEKNKAIFNLYNRQLIKLKILNQLIHEDLAFDYAKQLERLII